MTGRADDGLRWMNAHESVWTDGVAGTHCWWHLALFHLGNGRADAALALYDERVRAARSEAVADLIDASALLWRVELQGGEPGDRWSELAAAWAPHIDDRFCSFTDMHAMLAFAGAQDWERARRLELSLVSSLPLRTRHAETTRRLGLPACRALAAFGRGDDGLAVSLLAALPPQARRMGGSHAQRDVLQLTLRRAVERMRRLRPGDRIELAAA
ncbi:MAG: hypothetical protein K8R60_03400 [Burkholderiales bacterium]|nr:hypothetical protein [Burkholderiales bacterium]